jgi:DNA-binding CsgD family transcriptional regulator
MNNRLHDDRLDGVINGIYEAGADEARWVGVLAELTELLGGSGAVLHVGDTDCSGFAFGANHNLDPEALDAYARYYFSINPLNPPLTRQPAGVVVSDEMLVPRREYYTSEFFNDYAMRFDIAGSATAVLAKADGHIACLGVVRRVGLDAYAKTELAFLERLLPHLQRAVDLNRKLAACRLERDQALAALNAMELAVLFIAADGSLLTTNTAGEKLFRAGGGITLRSRRLTAIDPKANTLLQAAIYAALNAEDERGGTVAVPRPAGQRPLLARVLPYLDSSSYLDSAAKAIVFIRDPDARGARTVAQVASAYGLTARETSVVEKLLEVSDVKLVAEQLGMSEVTARNHVARILAKTGTNKQVELVNVILSSRLPLR